MKLAKISGIIASFVFLTCLSAHAAQFSKADLKSMSELINNTYLLVGETGGDSNSIDILNTPLTEAQLVKFGVYYVYVFEADGVKHVSDGAPIKLYADMDPFTSYALVSIKAVTKQVEKIFGYKLNIPENSIGQVHGFTVTNGCFVLGESDPGADAPLVAVSAKRDGFGLVRVLCEQQDVENEKNKFRYRAVLKENMVDGQKNWQILLIKPIK